VKRPVERHVFVVLGGTGDLAGRKLTIDDPDLGDWDYAYDAMGNLTYQDDDLLPAERVSWRGLSSSQNALQTTIGKVCDFVATVSFVEDADEWVCTLQAARGQLQAATERRDIETLGAAVTDVADVVGRQTSRMNDRLIGALDALGLERLIGVLRRAQEEMARVPGGTDATLPRRLWNASRRIWPVSRGWRPA